MRKIVSGLFITLDGVVAAPEKWNPPYYDDEMTRAVIPQLTEADTHLYGRRSHELFRAVFTGPGAARIPHAKMMTNAKKVVVSTTLDRGRNGRAPVLRRRPADPQAPRIPAPSQRCRRAPLRQSRLTCRGAA
jgi:hypothetical protein